MDIFSRRKAAQAATAQPSSSPVCPRHTEVERVLALPRVVAYPPTTLGRRLRPGAEPLVLRPVQDRALAALAQCGGLLGAIGVGHGKSYIALLAGAVLDADLSVVLVAPATLPVMRNLLADLRARYDLPEVIIESWGTLSGQQGEAWLQALPVDGRRVVLVADEAHFARHKSSARTQRLMRWLREHPRVKFVALSGTLTTRTLDDFAHLAHRALGDGSPVPRGEEGRAWNDVLRNEPISPADYAACSPLWRWAECTRNVQFVTGATRLPQSSVDLLARAFGERLSTTPGVVLTQDASCAASLYLQAVPVDGPEVRGLHKRAEEIAQTYRDPAGMELADDSEVARTAKRLCFGYYYTWAWPGGVADREWLDLRQAWMRCCRAFLEAFGGEGFDTRGLVEQEARKRAANGVREGWVGTYLAWQEVEGRVKPTVTTTWVTDHVLRDLIAHARTQDPCIVWYDEEAVADKLAELGLRVVRAGQPVPEQACTVALSVRSHGAGLNLQAWSRQVFACVPSNGTAWEQALGRTHRQGQTEDEVWAWVPAWASPLRAALAKARADAQWIESSTGNRQKLMLATYVDL